MRKVRVPRPVLAILFITLGVMGINLFFARGTGWREMADIFLVTLIYSTSIGLLCYQAGSRFWRRGGKHGLALNIGVMAGAVVLGSVDIDVTAAVIQRLDQILPTVTVTPTAPQAGGEAPAQ